MEIVVTSCKTFSSNFETGNSLGYGSVVLNGVITIVYSIMKSNDGRVFISWPQKKKKEQSPEGKDQYQQYISFDAETKKYIDDIIISDFEKKDTKATKGITVSSLSKTEPYTAPVIEDSTTAQPVRKKKMSWSK